jgi:hypothetical protein
MSCPATAKTPSRNAALAQSEGGFEPLRDKGHILDAALVRLGYSNADKVQQMMKVQQRQD